MDKLAFIIDDSIISSENPLPEHHYSIAITLTENNAESTEYNYHNPISFATMKTKISNNVQFKTNAIIPGDGYKLLQQLIKKYEKIVICGISSEISSSYQSWLQILENFDQNKNQILLLKNQVIGETLYDYTLEALKQVEINDDWNIIKSVLNPVLNFSGILLIQELDTLYRGGRISLIKSKLTSLLNFKILIQYTNGKISYFNKAKSWDKTFKKIHQFITNNLSVNLSKPNKLHILSSFLDLEEFNKIKQQLIVYFPNTTFKISEMPKPILAHVGINALAITQ
ncbi:DegV family protein [[Mycoplasma] cavipharyngis]|uniref:DegV family protein n=1 Tax=[Mycoplasma] cavipharyngis TaxID=92757 RepID=UPI0037038D89